MDFVSKLSIIRYQYAEIMNASAQDLGNNGDRIKEFASILTNIIALLYTYSIVSCHFISKCFWNCYKIYAGNFR